MERTIYKLVGEKIREARTEKGLTQAEMAKALDFSSASISNIELGTQSVQLIDLYKIAQLLEKDVTFFLPSMNIFKSLAPSIENETEKLSPKGAAFVDSLRKQIKKEE